MEHSQNLKEVLDKVIGQRVLKVSIGENTGSIINIEFGEELKLVKTGKFEFKEGDYSLMINCSWRLGNGKSVITSWHEPNNFDGPMVRGLELIKDRKIVDIKLSRYYDLSIQMENEIELSVFSDLSKNQNIDTNWFFRDGLNNYVVSSLYQLSLHRK